MWRWGIAVCAVLLGACIEPEVTPCDGWVCPANTVCDDVHRGCVLADQLTSCGDDPDGTLCDIGSDTGNGICDRGICIDPFCGDGIVSGNEECDGAALGARPDCLDHDYYEAGAIVCDDGCRYDVSACERRCGDGVLDADDGEACDTNALDGKDCTDFGFQSPDGLACSDACIFVVSECESFCGDGVVAGDEDCDGTNLNGEDCTDQGYYDAAGLTCNDACAFVTTGCSGICGDNTKDPLEDCDGTDHAGLDCTDFGFYDEAGLACTGCGFNVTACTGTCGDGELGGTEYCDGAPPVGQYCTDFGFDYGRLDCSNFCSPDFASCGFFGWRRVATVPMSMWAVWASGQNDVFAAREDGGIVHFDGATWTEMNTGTTEAIYGIHGTGPTDVWAAAGPDMLHFDGTSWERTSVSTTDLHDVHANAPDDVWAVGNGVVYHFDGSTWTLQDTGSTKSFHSVWASGAEVFVTTQGGGGNVEVQRYDGTSWSADQLPISTWLADLWGSGPDDVYAIDQGSDYIWHYDGASWTGEPIGFYTDDGGIAGAAADDVWAVGNDGAMAFSAGGGRWIEIDPVTTDILQGVASAGPGDYFAVGTYGTILRGGPSWASVADVGRAIGVSYLIPSVPGEVLRRGSALSRYDGSTWRLLAGGGGVAVSIDPTGVIHMGPNLSHDGTGWIESATPDEVGGANAVYAPTANVLFVGTTSALWMRIGDSWTSRTMTTPNDISGTSFADVWAVGNFGSAARWDGSTWSSVSTGVSSALQGVWNRATDDAFAVGNSGVIRRWNGSSWIGMTSGVTSTLRDVWGSSASNVFAVGDQGTILHFDGTSWTSMTSPVGVALHDVWGRGANEVYAVGASGTILAYDGTTWSEMSSGVTGTLSSLHGDATRVVAVGGNAALIHTAATGWTASLYSDSLSNPVGGADDLYFQSFRDVLVHYDGANLTPVPVGTPPTSLLQVGGLAHDDVFALSGVYPGPYTLHHFDGIDWTSVGALPSGFVPVMHVIGPDDVLIQQGTTMSQFDGGTLSVGFAAAIDAAWGADGIAFAVGDDGLILRRVGGTWTPMISPTIEDLFDVWGRSADDVFAVGANATVMHFDGEVWTPVRVPTSGLISSVTGSNADLFLNTDEGVLHLVGQLRPHVGP